MNRLVTFIRLIKINRSEFFSVILQKIRFFLPTKNYLKLMFRIRMGYKLNLNNPKTFCEKIQWLKIHRHNPFYTKLVDKYNVKSYISENIGNQHVIPTLGVWDKFDDIDFTKLPNQFVLKCTHDSGGLVICKEKQSFNIEGARKKINKSLRHNYYKIFREWPYKNVPPRIIAEKYMEDDCGKELADYKFYCFDGEPRYCQVIRNRFSDERIDFYDLEWNLMPFVGLNPRIKNGSTPIPKPLCLEEMIEACKKLSKEISFVRVDFYVIHNNYFFGEMTFYPASGFGTFYPNEWNLRIGNMLKL